MSNKKTLEKLCRAPPPSDLRWSELVTLLKSLGYRMLTSGGSRRKFYHQEKDALISCHEPHPSPNVDKGCIVDIAAHLKAYGFLKRNG